MRHVFPTDNIAHLWAVQSQDDARNPQKNFYFNGKMIYSYRDNFPVGLLIEDAESKGGYLALVNDMSYSVTTSKHQNMVERAVRGRYDVVCVESAELLDRIDDAIAYSKRDDEYHTVEGMKNQVERVARSMKYLVTDDAVDVKKMLRSSVHGKRGIEQAQKRVLGYQRLIATLKRVGVWDGEYEECVATERAITEKIDALTGAWQEWQSKYAGNDDWSSERRRRASEAARRGMETRRENERRESRERSERYWRSQGQGVGMYGPFLPVEETLKRWVRGVNVPSSWCNADEWYRTFQQGSAWLRIGTEGKHVVVKTSQGVTIPLAVARMLLRKWSEAVAFGADVTVDVPVWGKGSISKDGEVRVGCHVIKPEAVRLVAPYVEKGVVAA